MAISRKRITKDNTRMIKCPFCGFEFIKTIEVDKNRNKPLTVLSCPKCGKAIDRIITPKKEQ